MRTMARDMAARTAPSTPARIPPEAGSGAGPADDSAPSMEVPLSRMACGPVPKVPGPGASIPARCASSVGAVLEDALRAALAAAGLHARRVAAQDPIAVRAALDLAAGHQLTQRGGHRGPAGADHRGQRAM